MGGQSARASWPPPSGGLERGSEGSELTGELRDGVRFGLGLVFAAEGVELLLEQLKLGLEGADVDGAWGIARLAFRLVRDRGARARWRSDGSWCR